MEDFTPFRRQTSKLIYSGMDRHSFGMHKPASPQTPPDRGPWSWDRTGGPEDVEPVIKRSCRAKSVRTQQEITTTSVAETIRNYVRGLPSGSLFKGYEAGNVAPDDHVDRHRTTQFALKDLLAAGLVEKVKFGTWRRV